MNNQKSGSRIGACLTLIFLSLIAMILSSFVIELVQAAVGLFSFLPAFVFNLLFYMAAPLILFIMFFPVSMFFSWASECSERICETRHGLRYKVIFIYFTIITVINIFTVVFRFAHYQNYMLMSALYAFIFWGLHSTYHR